MTPLKSILRIAFKVLTYLLFMVTLLAAYGGFFNPEYWTLPAIAILVFPYLAIATLVVAVSWLIMRQYLTGGIGVAVILISLPSFSSAVPLHFRNSEPYGAPTFKMITFNCLHFTDLKEPDSQSNRSLSYLIESGADFICLQEVRAYDLDHKFGVARLQADSLLTLYPYAGVSRNLDVCFLSKFPFEELCFKKDKTIKYGSWNAYRLDIDGEPLTVVNVHLSSYMLSQTEREIFTELKDEGGAKKSIKEFEGSVFNKMKSAFKERAKVSAEIAEALKNVEGPIIVCGDFNDVPGSWTYRNFTKAGFKDAYAQTGFGHIITYNEHLMYFHIDQILYRGGLLPLYVQKSKLDASDHFPLEAEFAFVESLP